MGVYLHNMEMPKGTNMMLLISPDGDVWEMGDLLGDDKHLDGVKAVPAADVREVVRGKWKRIDYKPCGHDYECSSCGWKNDMATNFCPNCGADMRQTEEEI